MDTSYDITVRFLVGALPPTAKTRGLTEGDDCGGYLSEGTLTFRGLQSKTLPVTVIDDHQAEKLEKATVTRKAYVECVWCAIYPIVQGGQAALRLTTVRVIVPTRIPLNHWRSPRTTLTRTTAEGRSPIGGTHSNSSSSCSMETVGRRERCFQRLHDAIGVRLSDGRGSTTTDCGMVGG